MSGRIRRSMLLEPVCHYQAENPQLMELPHIGQRHYHAIDIQHQPSKLPGSQLWLLPYMAYIYAQWSFRQLQWLHYIYICLDIFEHTILQELIQGLNQSVRACPKVMRASVWIAAEALSEGGHLPSDV